MLNLSNRRYTGAKSKLLAPIEKILQKSFFSKANEADFKNEALKTRTNEKGSNLNHKVKTNTNEQEKPSFKEKAFFEAFAGTAVISEHFLKYSNLNHFYINDFLHSNFIIYQGFFSQESFDEKKLLAYAKLYNALDLKEQNYYSLYYGDKFFSLKDAIKIGFIREHLDEGLKNKELNLKEFHILLASLLYSVDRIANTVGHYDAYRKNQILKDKFEFKLIKPIKTDKKIELFREDANALAKKLRKEFEAKKAKFECVFLDPPYNSRQYSRFYHLLENLAQNKKPKLYGVALKPEPENLSKYCQNEALKALKDLTSNLAPISKNIVMTYNNT
ncbi:hypothetical protein DMB92_06760, partial [Campylobacter sp. MIT 99-7217]